MKGLLIVAVRDLDPPAGGAEMSLATLLKGVSVPGLLETANVDYVPCEGDPSIDDSESVEGWDVVIFQSDSRGDATDLTNDSNLTRNTLSIPVEDLLSGAAWRLRDSSGNPNHLLYRSHLKRANKKFTRYIGEEIVALVEEAKKRDQPIVGVTQLHWSAGAAKVFEMAKVPYLAFVRDELQSRNRDVYRSSLENAAVVCCAGEGLGLQVTENFSIKSLANIRLPVDFGGRFGSIESVIGSRSKGMEGRKDPDVPRISVVGVTPEKGFAFYQKLFPYLAKVWPEARVDIYGGGSYAEKLGGFENVTWHGHTPVSDVFSVCDIHMLTVESTGSWGRVINEAGLFGVPTVTIGIGSQPEAVGQGGCVVPSSGSLNEWVSALKKCYDERLELGELARQHCSIVDHRRSIAAFRSVLEQFKV